MQEQVKRRRRNKVNPMRWRKNKFQPRPWEKSKDKDNPEKKSQGEAKPWGKSSTRETAPGVKGPKRTKIPYRDRRSA